MGLQGRAQHINFDCSHLPRKIISKCPSGIPRMNFLEFPGLPRMCRDKLKFGFSGTPVCCSWFCLFAIFGGFVRNFSWVFAILCEVLLIEIQEEIHHFAGWEGGVIVNKHFVNKRASPKDFFCDTKAWSCSFLELLTRAQGLCVKKRSLLEKDFKRGKLFYLHVGAFLLTVKLLAYSPLRPLLEALSHCKQKTSNCK